jgi:uracil-DNA glycosylase
MTDRSTILREMGLTPIWASRSATTAQPTEQTTVVSERADGPSTPERDAQIAAMSWQALAASITQCTACALSHSRNKAVPGMGDPAASWMVIGDAPDDHDDKQGVAFTDQAGQLLDAMLKSVGKTRTQGALLTHLVKCHPPNNRRPEPDEIKACAPYLKRQIALAAPKLLLSVGDCSAQTLLNRDDNLGALRGVDGAFEAVAVVVTYHPSQLLRSPLDKAKAWEDLLRAQAISAAL